VWRNVPAEASVSVRKIESVTMLRMNPAMFAPATVRIRRMPKRISGSGCRSLWMPPESGEGAAPRDSPAAMMNSHEA